jgi:hypothetical protein
MLIEQPTLFPQGDEADDILLVQRGKEAWRDHQQRLPFYRQNTWIDFILGIKSLCPHWRSFCEPGNHDTPPANWNWDGKLDAGASIVLMTRSPWYAPIRAKFILSRGNNGGTFWTQGTFESSRGEFFFAVTRYHGNSCGIYTSDESFHTDDFILAVGAAAESLVELRRMQTEFAKRAIPSDDTPFDFAELNAMDSDLGRM